MKVSKTFLIAAVVAAQGLMAPATMAMTATCADRTQVVQRLNERFGEALYGNAVSNAGDVLEVYTNETSQTWTILVTLPDRGLSCLVASGTGDQRLSSQLANL